MNTDSLEKWTANLLVFLAIGAFILSFAGMYAVAVDAGYGWLSYLWPLVTESAVVIFSLLYLVAKLKDYKNGYLMPVIVGCTILSVVFNVWHSPKTDYLSRAVFALPPLFLFAAFKGYLWKIEQDTKRQGMIASLLELTRQLNERTEALERTQQEERQLSTTVDTITRQIDTKRQELNALAGEGKRLTSQVEALKAEQQALNIGQISPKVDTLNAARQDKRQERLDTLLAYLVNHPQASLTEAGQQIGVSRQTVSGYVNELTQAGKLHKNGNGWEMIR